MNKTDRIMAIDYGDARVGVAVCDPLGLTAQGVETIKNTGQARTIRAAVGTAWAIYPFRGCDWAAKKHERYAWRAGAKEHCV